MPGADRLSIDRVLTRYPVTRKSHRSTVDSCPCCLLNPLGLVGQTTPRRLSPVALARASRPLFDRPATSRPIHWPARSIGIGIGRHKNQTNETHHKRRPAPPIPRRSPIVTAGSVPAGGFAGS